MFWLMARPTSFGSPVLPPSALRSESPTSEKLGRSLVRSLTASRALELVAELGSRSLMPSAPAAGGAAAALGPPPWRRGCYATLMLQSQLNRPTLSTTRAPNTIVRQMKRLVESFTPGSLTTLTEVPVAKNTTCISLYCTKWQKRLSTMR